MTVSDYIWDYLYNNGVTHVFYLPGGGNMHLVDALGRSQITGVPMHHEQACGIAAIGYSQLKQSLGVCLVTTGPGGTNAITPCVAAWIDEVPILFISGQVPTHMMTNGEVRQKGPQEVPIAPLVSQITCYSLVSFDGYIRSDLPFLLDKSLSHPKGPVWLDVPLDVQSAIV